ncbi:hypothetical protein ACIGXM_14275 [Kitasatospora sp. NPDC052896]|uniref:hypothetical protein n=1 Tax=Kitasatospora sp. NPDC052896 TaxID=3364061 RepID=UPI0037CBA6E8
MTDFSITSSPATSGDFLTSNSFNDGRIFNYPPIALVNDPGYGGLTTGYITSASTTQNGQKSPTNPQGSFTLNFMFNPSTVSVSHTLDASTQMVPPYLRDSSDTGVPLTTSGGTLSFSLLFDRTYEVWDGTTGNLAHDLGVLVDIYALYGLTGIVTPLSATQQTSAAGQSSSDATSSSSSSSDQSNLQNALSITPNAVTGTMQMYPVWTVFALNSMFRGGANSPSWMTLPDIAVMRYFGYIASIGITYTHFTQNLIPFRCAVDLSVQLMASAGYQ